MVENRRLAAVVAWGIALVVTVAPAARAQARAAADPARDSVRVTADRATIWTSPALPVPMTQVNTGTVLEVLDHRGVWYNVRLPFDPTRNGYILAREIEAVAAPPKPPVTTEPPAAAGEAVQRIQNKESEVAPAATTAPVSAPPPASPPAPLPSAMPPAPASKTSLAVVAVKTAPRLTEIAAARAAEFAVTDFRQNQPGDGEPSSVSTSAYVSYDDANLYVAFDCRDDPAHVRGRLAKREDIGEDDQVILYLDTFHDRRRAYVFNVNPLGVQRDGVVTEGQKVDYTFDAVWRSEGVMTDHGYAVLMTIPFKSLRFPNAPVQTWGIALGRYVPRTSEFSYWPYITNRIDGFVNQLGDLTNMQRLPQRQSVQLIPYAVATGSRILNTKAAAYDRTNDGRFGLDSKIVMRGATTVDATLNPDFSQVESDQPQVTVNKRYAVFYPEKRPFFLESAGFFGTPEQLFYSRRIIDPEFGVRLTGKSGPWTVGALVSDDRAEGLSLSPTSSLFGRHAIASVGRVQREVGKESFVGVMATDREFSTDFSRVISADTRLKVTPNWIVTAQAVYTANQSGDSELQRGSALSADITRNGRHLTVSTSYLDRTPEYDAPLGFIKRTDIREWANYAAYFWRPAKGSLIAFGPSILTTVDWDHSSVLQEWYALPEFDFYFRRQIQIKVSRSQSYELFDGVRLDEHSNYVSTKIATSKKVSVNVSFDNGVSPNYSPAAGLDPFVATSRSASLGATIRPNQKFRLDQTYYYTNLSLASGGAVQGGEIFTNHISRTKVNLQFTKALSLRAIADYNTLTPNPALIAQTLSKKLTGDVLATYLLNPFTALYVGYTEGYQNLTIDESGRPRVRIVASPSLLTSRQVFVKLSYRFGL